jgi:NitT/TauT family transport system substrate-binding protein
MVHSRRTVLGAAAAGFAGTPRPAWAQPAPATIRIATIPSELITPYAYAVRAGLFDRAGVKFEVSRASSGAAVAAAIAGGAIDIGITSVLAVVLGHARGVPLTVVAPAGLEMPDAQSGLLVLNDSPLRIAKDFNGKTIAAAAVNDIISLSMKCWMDQNGGDSSSFKVVEIPQLSQLAALEAGRVDGIALANPAYTIAMSGGKVRSVANIHGAVAPRYLLAMWFSSTTWVERNRSTAERFARTVADAVGYVNAHQAETVDDVVAATGLERSLVLRMKRFPQVPNVLASDLQPVIDAAARYKMIERSYPAAEIISDAAVR